MSTGMNVTSWRILFSILPLPAPGLLRSSSSAFWAWLRLLWIQGFLSALPKSTDSSDRDWKDSRFKSRQCLQKTIVWIKSIMWNISTLKLQKKKKWLKLYIFYWVFLFCFVFYKWYTKWFQQFSNPGKGFTFSLPKWEFQEVGELASHPVLCISHNYLLSSTSLNSFSTTSHYQTPSFVIFSLTEFLHCVFNNHIICSL